LRTALVWRWGAKGHKDMRNRAEEIDQHAAYKKRDVSSCQSGSPIGALYAIWWSEPPVQQLAGVRAQEPGPWGEMYFTTEMIYPGRYDAAAC
jgi:hypothetical protein